MQREFFASSNKRHWKLVSFSQPNDMLTQWNLVSVSIFQTLLQILTIRPKLCALLPVLSFCLSACLYFCAFCVLLKHLVFELVLVPILPAASLILCFHPSMRTVYPWKHAGATLMRWKVQSSLSKVNFLLKQLLKLCLVWHLTGWCFLFCQSQTLTA